MAAQMRPCWEDLHHGNGPTLLIREPVASIPLPPAQAMDTERQAPAYGDSQTEEDHRDVNSTCIRVGCVVSEEVGVGTGRFILEGG